MATQTLAQVGTRRLGFESMEEEIHVPDLAVTGELPNWLGGTLVRVTPAKFEIGGRTTRHWFDGLAMLNAFSFTGGGVAYRSRFVEGRAYEAAREGREDYVGFANDPCRSLFKRVAALFEPTMNDNCNVNLARLGERYVALTEVPPPIEFDPGTLDTGDLVGWKRRFGDLVSSAHPHFDPHTGEMINYLTHVGPTGASYRIFAAPDPRTKREIASVKTAKPAYVHSFAITERYLVFAEFPLSVGPLRFLAEFVARPRPIAHMLRWEPERGTRFFVIDRRTGERRGTFESEGFFAFHHANAFERGDELVVDIVVSEDGPSAIRLLEIERARDPGQPIAAQARLHRFRLPLDGGPVRDERLSEAQLELPRINYGRVNGAAYRWLYAVAMRGPESDWFDRLVKVDAEDGRVVEWAEDGCYPGEPVFVPSPDATGEDDGVVLSVVLDSRTLRSFLLVLDARGFAELARAEAPHHVPFGFHGDYFEEV